MPISKIFRLFQLHWFRFSVIMVLRIANSWWWNYVVQLATVTTLKNSTQLHGRCGTPHVSRALSSIKYPTLYIGWSHYLLHNYPFLFPSRLATVISILSALTLPIGQVRQLDLRKKNCNSPKRSFSQRPCTMNNATIVNSHRREGCRWLRRLEVGQIRESSQSHVHSTWSGLPLAA